MCYNYIGGHRQAAEILLISALQSEPVALRKSAADSNSGHNKEVCMAVRFNEDAELVRTVKEGLEKSGGYCPCRIERSEENRCICREFREQIADPEFEGYCHCMLYYKSKEK